MCYDRTGISEGIDVIKSSNCKERLVYHCCYFNHKFKFQKSVCTGCHNLLMLYNITMITIICIDYCFYYCWLLFLLRNSVLHDHGYI